MDVQVEGVELVVRVRHKATVAPIFGLSTGKTLRDTSVTLGAIEHNIDKRATRLHGQVTYSERGFNFDVGFTQHPYDPHRWAQEYELYYAGSGFRFEDTTSTWVRNRFGAVAEVISPLSYRNRFQYELAFLPYYERNTRSADQATPADGAHLGVLGEAIYDAYHWDDLVPSGIRLVLELRPGVFTGDQLFRGEARFKLSAAVRLGPKTVLKIAGHAAIVNPGDPNHSLLLGSQQGVRGLSDSLYRNFAHAFTNIELRHAFQLARRWFLQPALFTDAAAFQPMNARGDRERWIAGLNTGGGLRLIPTALVNVLLRVDAAWLHLPEPGWLIQGGISQYF